MDFRTNGRTRSHRAKSREADSRTAAQSPAAERRRLVNPSKYYRYKYAIEWLLAVMMLVPALPFIGMLYLVVRGTSRGPGFYLQERVGLNGRKFWLIKLRSMRMDAESATGPVWAKPNDDRATWVGRILRQTHLDELPQLLNVVKGDMTLVGPRPERPGFVEGFCRTIRNYDQRLKVRPGITGVAAIYLAADDSVDSVRKKLAFDLEYICSATLVTDFQVWLCTAFRLSGLRKGLGPKITLLNYRIERYRKRIRERIAPLHVTLKLKSQRKKLKRRRQKASNSYGSVAAMSDSSLNLFLDGVHTIPVNDPRKPR